LRKLAERRRLAESDRMRKPNNLLLAFRVRRRYPGSTFWRLSATWSRPTAGSAPSETRRTAIWSW